VVDSLREKVRAEGAGMVVVDSLMAALGGPIVPEYTTPFYNALRSLGAEVTPVIVHHLSKSELGRENGPPQAYGDVTITNRARAAWALARDEAHDDPEEMEIVMTNTKMNGAAIQPSIGLGIRHQDAEGDDYAISVSQFDPLTAGSTNLRLGDRVIAALRGGELKEADLLETTGASRTALRRTLDRMVERTVVEREGGGRGRGNAVIFRLAPARLNGHL
jgi:hypothetical protein